MDAAKRSRENGQGQTINRVQFNPPDNLISDGSVFGHSTSEYLRPDFTTGARQIQMGIKLSF